MLRWLTVEDKNRDKGPTWLGPTRQPRTFRAQEVRRVDSDDFYDPSLQGFLKMPHPVVLKGRWEHQGELFPETLVGRIVRNSGESVTVRFRGRGVFRFKVTDLVRY